MSHPTSPNPTEAELAAWANCSVPDCPNKVTHDSDKCYPHTYGWEPVRRNLRKRLHTGNPSKQTVAEIEKQLREIANNKPDFI